MMLISMALARGNQTIKTVVMITLAEVERERKKEEQVCELVGESGGGGICVEKIRGRERVIGVSTPRGCAGNTTSVV